MIGKAAPAKERPYIGAPTGDVKPLTGLANEGQGNILTAIQSCSFLISDSHWRLRLDGIGLLAARWILAGKKYLRPVGFVVEIVKELIPQRSD